MEKVNILRVYNLLNANGDRLQLRLGYIVDDRGTPCNGNAAWRWSFEGKKIPMPVRSRTWFCGFPEHTMIDWLKGNGWHVRTRVDTGCGHAEVFELPNGNENTEANDHMATSALTNAICLLLQNKRYVSALHLYKMVYGGTLDEAKVAVREIIDRQK